MRSWAESPTTHQNPYQAALENLDGDGPQYITSNTLDEQSHAAFLNAYLIAKGQAPVDLDKFRTLAEQPGNRRAANRPVNQPHAA